MIAVIEHDDGTVEHIHNVGNVTEMPETNTVSYAKDTDTHEPEEWDTFADAFRYIEDARLVKVHTEEWQEFVNFSDKC